MWRVLVLALSCAACSSQPVEKKNDDNLIRLNAFDYYPSRPSLIDKPVVIEVEKRIARQEPTARLKPIHCAKISSTTIREVNAKLDCLIEYIK